MSNSEILFDFSPSFQIYKDGRINRSTAIQRVPPSLHPKDSVGSKDVVCSPESNLCSRVYLPKHIIPGRKLPLLIYFHGGVFCFGSPAFSFQHDCQKTMVQAANIVMVSVDYRLAPEHPLPAAYNDGWDALKWVASHADGNGPEEWLNSHADLDNVFFAGDSAGGNLAYNMCRRYSREKLVGINLKGIALMDSYFWRKDVQVGDSCKDMKTKEMMDKLWPFLFPTTSGLDDPFINPEADPNLASLDCSRMIIFVAQEDRYLLADRGRSFYEALKKSGYGGNVEIMESEGEDHCFHLRDCESQRAKALFEKLSSFLNHQDSTCI
ncbi:hypothetical protein K2173_001149 [Erythroxylum novogranatense]|uniref:Alpha/beta hydrolase fold-3 domain-containing protein n=1 Tax=Erythroxylum novogranatense TaxID=1862640 RepID=A0AAV8TKE3_9ROSI|nr:hypothetical protein K2173_001149 [Erythroxylum novogranatense]